MVQVAVQLGLRDIQEMLEKSDEFTGKSTFSLSLIKHPSHLYHLYVCVAGCPGDDVGVYQKGEILKASQYKKEFFPQHKMEDLALSSATPTINDSLHLPADNIASAMTKEGKWSVPGALAPASAPTPAQSFPVSTVCSKCEEFAFREVFLSIAMITLSSLAFCCLLFLLFCVSFLSHDSIPTHTAHSS